MRLQQGAEDGDPAEEAEGAAGLGVAGGAAGGLLEGDPVGAGKGRQAGGDLVIAGAVGDQLDARSAAALATRVMRRRSMKAPMKAMPAAMVRPSPAPRAAIREVVERIGSCRPVRPEDALAGCSGRILDRAQ
jgi:hypothetical protein